MFKPQTNEELRKAVEYHIRRSRPRNKYPPIGEWDTSLITDMSALFCKNNCESRIRIKYTKFNEDINDWDVSNVTDMSGMFQNAENFNQPLDKWDVSKVTNMELMFRTCAFNHPINNWDVSKVTNMKAMFSGKFNQPLDKWDVSNVTNMESMFVWTRFNQPINNWNVSKVTNMNWMFHYAVDFNQPLNNWDVSSIGENFCGMFCHARAFNQNIAVWKLTNVQFRSAPSDAALKTYLFHDSTIAFEDKNLTKIYDYEALKERMYSTGLKQALMKNRFHPKYMDAWEGWGQD